MPSAATQVRVPCAICATEFVQKHRRQRYCSKRCLWKSKNDRRWAQDREGRLAANRAFHHANKPTMNEKSRAYYHANRARIRTEQRAAYLRAQAETPWVFSVASAKTRAKEKRLPFDLTNEWARVRWTGRCELTGIPFIPTVGPGPKMYSATIDKIDPKLGYVQSNCRFILQSVNALKSTGTDDEMYAVAKALIRMQPS